MARQDDPTPMSVRVPADVDRPDKIVFGLTARQAAIAATVGVALWGLFHATSGLVPPVVFAVAALPVAGATLGLLLVRHDGLGLDEWLAHAWRHRRQPKRLVPTTGATVSAPPEWVTAGAGPLPAPMKLPADAISHTGQVDLGADGISAILACSTVNFGLRTPTEQHSLVAGFARWLHALSGPAQIVVRADRLDLDDYVDALRADAPSLPHPALEAACRDHATYLEGLAADADLLRRHVLVVLRHPAGRGGRDVAAQAITRRAAETSRALGACEITARTLDGAATHAVLATAAAPDSPHPGARQARGAADTVTADDDLVDALLTDHRPRSRP